MPDQYGRCPISSAEVPRWPGDSPRGASAATVVTATPFASAPSVTKPSVRSAPSVVTAVETAIIRIRTPIKVRPGPNHHRRRRSGINGRTINGSAIWSTVIGWRGHRCADHRAGGQSSRHTAGHRPRTGMSLARSKCCQRDRQRRRQSYFINSFHITFLCLREPIVPCY